MEGSLVFDSLLLIINDPSVQSKKQFVIFVHLIVAVIANFFFNLMWLRDPWVL